MEGRDPLYFFGGIYVHGLKTLLRVNINGKRAPASLDDLVVHADHQFR